MFNDREKCNGRCHREPFYVHFVDRRAGKDTFLKFMEVAYASNTPRCINHARYAEPDMLKEKHLILTQCNKVYSVPPINAISFQLPERIDKRSVSQDAEKQSDKILERDWCKFLTLSNCYSSKSDKFTNMLTQLERMWDGLRVRLRPWGAEKILRKRIAE